MLLEHQNATTTIRIGDTWLPDRESSSYPTSCLSTANLHIPQDSVQTPGVSDHHPECAGQEQGNEETSGPGDQQQYVSSSSGAATHTDKIEETVITSMKLISTQLGMIVNNKVGIRATDVALGLRRIPAGFYAVVRHSGLEWRTENERSSVNIDVAEWNGPIPM